MVSVFPTTTIGDFEKEIERVMSTGINRTPWMLFYNFPGSNGHTSTPPPESLTKSINPLVASLMVFLLTSLCFCCVLLYVNVTQLKGQISRDEAKIRERDEEILKLKENHDICKDDYRQLMAENIIAMRMLSQELNNDRKQMTNLAGLYLNPSLPHSNWSIDSVPFGNDLGSNPYQPNQAPYPY